MALFKQLKQKLALGTRGREPALDATACLERASLHHGQGDYVAALADYDRAIPLLSDKAELTAAYLNRARVQRSLGNVPAAAADATKGIELVPTLGLGYEERGIAFWAQGDAHTALPDFGGRLPFCRTVSTEPLSTPTGPPVIRSWGTTKLLLQISLAPKMSTRTARQVRNAGSFRMR